MDKNVILSIFIATYNRKEIVVNKIKELLRIQSQELDICVLDDVSGDGTTDALTQIKDLRLHIGTNSERVGILKDGAMPNWYHLLLQVLLIKNLNVQRWFRLQCGICFIVHWIMRFLSVMPVKRHIMELNLWNWQEKNFLR